MKKIADMSAEELAGLVCETLLQAGITTTLSGGGCVAIWSNDRQALEQAVLVAKAQPIDMTDLRQWAKAEEATEKLIDFEKTLDSAQFD